MVSKDQRRRQLAREKYERQQQRRAQQRTKVRKRNAAIAGAVHFIENGGGGVARPQEIGMQGVAMPLGGRRPGRRHQRLGQDLTAKDPLRPVVRVGAPEDIFLDLFQVEQANQFGDGTGHRPALKHKPSCLPRIFAKILIHLINPVTGTGAGRMLRARPDLSPEKVRRDRIFAAFCVPPVTCRV